MTPAMIAALSANRALITLFVQADLPDRTVRLLIGSGEVMWGTDKFVGYDPAFGFIDSGDDISESADGQAPNTSFTAVLSPDVDPLDVAGPQVQLSRFQVWLAALELDVSSHLQVVPDPDRLFDGFIDQATINLDQQREDAEFTVVSAFDYFFEDSEGQRLNGQFHRSIWPGEKGLDNVTGITKKIYWGTNPPPGMLSGSGGTTLGGGLSGGGIIQPQFGGARP
jgi:hypothetical protein